MSRDPIGMRPFETLTRDEKLAYYDSHNGDARTSPDLNLRLFGKCGCPWCSRIRHEWATNPAPINDQQRKGSRAMSSVNICDRCGSMVTGVALGALTIRTSADYETSETITKELCPDCVAIVVGIADQADAEPVRRSYRKPWVRPTEEKDTVRGLIKQIVQEVHDAKKAIGAGEETTTETTTA